MPYLGRLEGWLGGRGLSPLNICSRSACCALLLGGAVDFARDGDGLGLVGGDFARGGGDSARGDGDRSRDSCSLIAFSSPASQRH